MPEGPGVRVDTGVGDGDRVPPDYDNLVAKVMVHAGDRPAAIARLRRALDETEIAGIQTTLPFHRFVARHRGFAAAELSTDWVAETWDGPAERAAIIRVAAAAAASTAATPTTPPTASPAGDRPPAVSAPNGWAIAARADAVDRWPR
jgi:acetyl-CoA carboxylase biotin carboxylase subunit